MPPESDQPLSAEQAQALFDILTHHQLSNEITKFKYPEAIDRYGPPFQAGLAKQDKASTSPILQSLLQRFICSLPGLRDVDKDFWQERCLNIVKKLAESELSESYDKGKIGSRRALATASAVLLEYPARGCLGGYTKRDGQTRQQEYDNADADDVMKAWDDFCQELVYGEMIDELFDSTAESDKLEEHSALVQAAHEYMLVNLASFLHFIMVHSPDGPYLARVIENVHKLVPYSVMRQTLKIGNAATMINSMVRLLLTKLSVSSLTNWMGITNSADTGMNMLQTIVSTIIGWDISALHKQISKIEKQDDAPSPEYLNCIKIHMTKSRDEHDAVRSISQAEEKSIVAVIFENADLDFEEITESQHEIAMNHLSIHLSSRDREQLSNLVCAQQPDLVTQAIRELVTAYDPIIRSIHSAVDLSAGLSDFEAFMNDFIKLNRPPTANSKDHNPTNESKSGTSTPVPQSQPQGLASVEDYVRLLRKHTPSSHRFFHQICKNGPEVADTYRAYVKQVASHFRPHGNSTSKPAAPAGAGALTPQLNKLVAALPAAQRNTVLAQLDAHFAYTMAQQAATRDRMRAVLSNTAAAGDPDASTMYGTGRYLTRWQQLLDSTLISPRTARGPVRRGADRSVREAEAVDVDGSVKVRGDVGLEDMGLQPPGIEAVTGALGDKFRGLLEEAWLKGEKGKG